MEYVITAKALIKDLGVKVVRNFASTMVSFFLAVNANASFLGDTVDIAGVPGTVDQAVVIGAGVEVYSGLSGGTNFFCGSVTDGSFQCGFLSTTPDFLALDFRQSSAGPELTLWLYGSYASFSLMVSGIQFSDPQLDVAGLTLIEEVGGQPFVDPSTGLPLDINTQGSVTPLGSALSTSGSADAFTIDIAAGTYGQRLIWRVDTVVSAVPLPAGLMLFLSALGALLMVRLNGSL